MNFPSDLEKFSGKFLSIGLNAHYPERLFEFLNHIEKTCFDSRNFDINIAISTHNEDLIKKLTDYKNNSKLDIRFITTPYDYWTANHNANKLLFSASEKTTYFYTSLSDRYRFSSQNWDLIIKQYIGTVPDDMFILRINKYSRFMQPRKSLYQAWHKPENWGIYTRKYLETIGGFPTNQFCHDCSVEMVHYFVTDTKEDYVRDINIAPELLNENNIILSEASNLEGFYLRYYRAIFYYHKYFFSRDSIEYLKKCASKIALKHIAFIKSLENYSISEDKKYCYLTNSSGKIIKKISYKVSYLFAIKQKLIAIFGSTNGFTYAYKFHFLLKRQWGYNFLNKLIENKHSKSTSKINKIISTKILGLLRFVLFSEPMNHKILEKMQDKNFKNFIQSKKAQELNQSKFWKISTKNLATKQESSL